jgi:DNA-binding PucR family transcriptional regulator
VCSGDHLPALLLRSDERLATDLAADLLAPLSAETPASAEKLTATLAAWLDHQGRIEAVARLLDVHPQTVRYRLGRLRDLFGDQLDDPDGRFALAVALRC